MYLGLYYIINMYVDPYLYHLNLIKSCRIDIPTQINHVPGTRFELVTRGFSVLCSTS